MRIYDWAVRRFNLLLIGALLAIVVAAWFYNGDARIIFFGLLIAAIYVLIELSRRRSLRHPQIDPANPGGERR